MSRLFFLRLDVCFFPFNWMRLLFFGLACFQALVKNAINIPIKSFTQQQQQPDEMVPENSIKKGCTLKSVAPTAFRPTTQINLRMWPSHFPHRFLEFYGGFVHTKSEYETIPLANIQLTVSALLTHRWMRTWTSLWPKIYHFGGRRQWNFSTPTCMTWMWMRLILSTLNGALPGTHTHYNAWISPSFLIHVRTV